MAEIVELERRITAALDRIARGLDGLAAPQAAGLAEAVAGAGAPMAVDVDPADLAADPLPEDRADSADEAVAAATAELRAALAAAAEREAMLRAQYEDRIAQMTRQLDVQGLEMQRMRKTAVALREEVRRLREGAAAGLIEPGQINRAMLAELDALRASRLSELAELNEISAALDDHLTEAEHA